MAYSREMPDWISCKSDGDTYDSKWIPSNGKEWQMHFGMSDAEAIKKNAHYKGLGFVRTSSYTCDSVSAAVWRKK